MRINRLFRALAALSGLVAVVTVAAMAAGTAGSQTDPLVTLSYLESTYTNTLLQKADASFQSRNKELEQALADQVAAMKKEVSSQSVQTGSAATFTAMTLTKGQTLTGAVGTEVLLRQGSAVCAASSAPGLVDLTGGSEVQNGGALTANHLYLMTADGRGVTAASDSVTLLVRGTCSLS